MKNLKRHHDEESLDETEFKASKAAVLEAAKRRRLSPVEPQPEPAHQHAATAPAPTTAAATESTEPPSTAAQVPHPHTAISPLAAGYPPAESTSQGGIYPTRGTAVFLGGGPGVFSFAPPPPPLGAIRVRPCVARFEIPLHRHSARNGAQKYKSKNEPNSTGTANETKMTGVPGLRRILRCQALFPVVLEMSITKP